jgi:hypothetical protein
MISSSQLGFQKAKKAKKSPVYLFYEIIANGSGGTPGDDEDVHYRCLHGSHKVCTIKKSMRSNLNGTFYVFVTYRHYRSLQANSFVSSC